MAPAAPKDRRSDPVAMDWFFENALDPFLIVRDGMILNANPAWEQLTGWSAKESIGDGYWSMLHPDDQEMIRGFGARLETEEVVGGEHRVLTRGGEWLWVRTRLHRAADGRAMVVLQDITGERAAIQEAQEAARVGEMLSMAAGVFVWRYSATSHDYEANTLTGANIDRRGRITLTDFDKLIHPDDRDRVNMQWAQSRRTGEAATVEYRSRQDTAWRRLRTAWQGVRQLPDGDWDMLGITQDVTELADARDAAVAAAEAKSQFLTNMSHEIRTPMNGVLGVLHILKARDLPGDSRSLIEEAVACGSTLAQLLNDIVDFSKIESGRLDLSPEPVDLESVVDVVASMLRPEAEGRGLYLITEAPVEAGWASLDPVRLRQMLFNLIGNAVKFTYRGGVRVTASVSGVGAAQTLRVEVKDTGVGIAPAAQASLFERFQQGDGSATRRFGGSGLGLAVTKALVQQMGGRIGFESDEGEGSTFWIETPAPVCDPPAPPAAETSQWLAGLRVLVVEDNASNRLVATRMLADLGATVDTAEDGAEGVACAEKTAYDLIFMDIQMPVMDGVEATRRIRALPGEVAHTPIVATTANVLAHQVETYRQVGMDGCVAKPISPAALLGEIARLAGAEAEAA